MLKFNSAFAHLLFEEANENPPAGDLQNDPPKEKQEESPKEQTVSYDEYQKLLARAKQLEEKEKTAREALKGKELEQMRANEKWQEIAEIKTREAEEAEKRYKSTVKAVQNDRKFSKLREAALAAGMRKEALDDIELYDFPEVQVETTEAGNIVVNGVKAAIDSLKVRRPYLFGNKSGNLNSALPEVKNGSRINVSQVLAAEKKWRQSQSAEDFREYERLNKALMNQR